MTITIEETGLFPGIRWARAKDHDGRRWVFEGPVDGSTIFGRVRTRAPGAGDYRYLSAKQTISIRDDLVRALQTHLHVTKVL